MRILFPLLLISLSASSASSAIAQDYVVPKTEWVGGARRFERLGLDE